MQNQLKMFFPVLPIRTAKIDAYYLDQNYLRLYKTQHTGIDVKGVS